MKNKLLVTNLALFLAADILATSYIINKVNRNNDVVIITPPEVTQAEIVPEETTIPLEYEIVEPEVTEVPESEMVETTEPPVVEETVPTESTVDEEVEEYEDGKMYLEREKTTPKVINTICEEGVINSDTEMYASPSLRSLNIKNLNINESVYRIFQTSNGWDLVRTENNEIGYILTSKIDYTGKKSAQDYNISIKNDIVLTTSNLNLRQGPSTEYESLRILDKETELQVLGEAEDDWLLVHLNGEIGFVKKDYTISILDKIHEMYPDLVLENLDVQKVVRLRDGLNYRRGPGTEYDVIREFFYCETMRVLGEYNDWYFGITDDYEIGFVSKDYATELNGTFIDIDILTQRMRMYNGNELMYYTRVKTGKDQTPSDIGHYKIYYMGENVNIVDDIVVDYWMNYNNGEGIHDLASCNSYGEDDYHYAGSNGCIRTPHENVAKIYRKSSIGTPVIVHE